MTTPISERSRLLMAFVIVATVISVMAAPALGCFGLLCMSFAGDASPSPFAMRCLLFYGGVGGALLGATPGLLAWALLGVRGVYPFLGAALAVAIPLIFPVDSVARNVLGPHVRDIELDGYVGAGAI